MFFQCPLASVYLIQQLINKNKNVFVKYLCSPVNLRRHLYVNINYL